MSVFDDMDALIVKYWGEDTLTDVVGLGEYDDADLIAELEDRGYMVYKASEGNE